MYHVVRIHHGSKGWGVKKDNDTVAKDLTAVKARRRASGLNHGIMDKTGRCLTRKERGLPEKKKVEET